MTLHNINAPAQKLIENCTKLLVEIMGDCRVVRYKNARVVKPGKPWPIIDELWVQGGRIIDPQKYFFDVAKRSDEEVDCKGLILAPGYIDIQCNGKLAICNSFVVLEALKLA